MTPLIGNNKPNPQIPLNVSALPANHGASPQSGGLSPSAVSTLAASSACGLLGYVSAPPKFDSCALLELDKDTFEKQTKRITKLDDTNPIKKAFKDYSELKENITKQTDDITAELFQGKTKVTADDVLKQLKKTYNHSTLGPLEAKLTKLLQRIESQEYIYSILEDLKKSNYVITEDIYKKLDEYYPNSSTIEFSRTLKNGKVKTRSVASLTSEKLPAYLQQYKEEFKKAFPIGTEIKEPEKALEDFITTHTKKAYENYNKLSRSYMKASAYTRIAAAAKDGAVTKEAANVIVNRNVKDFHLNLLNEHYNDFAKKLSKSRFKSAGKYFGLGLAAIVVSDFLINHFRKKS